MALHPPSITPVAVAVVAGFLLWSATSGPATAGTEPSWSPRASEKLVKLPARYLKKSLDHDFAESELGLALQGVDEEIGLKTGTLRDLQAATEKAEGELLTELRHQFLAEKKAYLDLIARRNDLRRRHIETKLGLFEKLLDRITDDQAAMTPEREDLIERQEAARQRFESTFDKVDVKLFESYTAKESRYNKQYTANMSAIEQLVAKVNRHAFNRSPGADENPRDKRGQINQMLGSARAELSLLQQEETMVGYMAKLVAFDALALADETAEASDDMSPPGSGDSGLTKAVGLFLNN